MIAALFVSRHGYYFGRPDVEPWDVERDAFGYAGPYAVVCHPPCARWGRYAKGGPSAAKPFTTGDDGGAFEFCLEAVRRYGGVLEHPAASKAWTWYGLRSPPAQGGWLEADRYGWTCRVDQGRYGHPARKATWLYLSGARPHPLDWTRARCAVRLDDGFHTAAERRAKVSAPKSKRLTKIECCLTPKPFTDVLIRLAESATGGSGSQRARLR